MSKYYVESFAYDYDMFMPHEKKQDNVVELNRKKATSTSAKAVARPSAGSVLIKVLAFICVLALVSGSILLRAQITEVTKSINEVQIQYDRALSENISLEMQLESSISYKNLEESARALGMQKAEPHQINYIYSVETDKLEVANGDTLVRAGADK